MGLSSILLAANNPLSHSVDKPVGPLTLHSVTLITTSALLVLLLMYAARKIATGPETEGTNRFVTRNPFAHIIEVLCLGLRDKVVKPQLGDQTDRFIGFLWTIFFFILINNLFGLIPLLDLQHLAGAAFFGDSHWAVVGSTATGNIAVTGALALIAFVVIQVNGIRSSGIKGWASHFLGGAPLFLAPIMLPVEILGMFIKPFALAVRLFANMIAGHTLLGTLLMFTGMAIGGLGVLGTPITLLSFIAAVPVMFLEIFVAFLQAFIFMFLTTIFIAQLMHHHHDDHEEAHSYEHGDASAVSDRAALVTQ